MRKANLFQGLIVAKKDGIKRGPGEEEHGGNESADHAGELENRPWSRKQWPNQRLKQYWPYLTRTQVQLLKEVFDMFDEDGTGYFTKDELLVVMKAMGGGYKPTPEDVDAVMFELDANNDHRVDFPEFLTKFMTVGDTEALMSVFKALAIQEDASGSSAITFDAIVRCFKITGDNLSDVDLKYLKQIFEEADTDGSGTLDVAEFMVQLEAIEDEEATAANEEAEAARDALAMKQRNLVSKALSASKAGRYDSAADMPDGMRRHSEAGGSNSSSSNIVPPEIGPSATHQQSVHTSELDPPASKSARGQAASGAAPGDVQAGSAPGASGGTPRAQSNMPQEDESSSKGAANSHSSAPSSSMPVDGNVGSRASAHLLAEVEPAAPPTDSHCDAIVTTPGQQQQHR